ncbi:MAG: site-2 protease family protein [Acutalibacteraceae bacterium]
MQFKIKNTSINLSFSFFALILIVLLSNSKEMYIYAFISAMLHECIHLFFITVFSGFPKSISLSIFGGNIERNIITCSYIQEFIINISAPIFNIILGVAMLFLNFKIFGAINIALGIFNILPFYNFDGGNALKIILIRIVSEEAADKIVFLISVVLTVGFTLFSIASVITSNMNYTVIFISIYMLVAVIFKK